MSSNKLTRVFMVVNLLTSLGDADGSMEMEGHWDLIRYQEFVSLNDAGWLKEQIGLWGAPSTYVSCKNSIKGALARLTQLRTCRRLLHKTYGRDPSSSLVIRQITDTRTLLGYNSIKILLIWKTTYHVLF